MSAQPFNRVLIANRGEIAQRICRAAEVAGYETVGVYATDDVDSAHLEHCGQIVPLSGAGPEAYLDIAELLGAAVRSGADAVHPGYGFRSESADFARACEKQGIVFLGPAAETLELFGNKAVARDMAARLDVPTLQGTAASADSAWMRESAQRLCATAGPVVLKAVAGGGGRGMRVLTSVDQVAPAVAECRAEALAAFGSGELYAEALLPTAQHVEVQVLGDGADAMHLWDRDCSVQRRHQKLVEVAPASNVAPGTRRAMLDCAVRLARQARLRGVATVEFLVSGTEFAFCEVNPRLQVEHTVTEEVLGIDLVRQQLALATGASLSELGFPSTEPVGASRPGAAVPEPDGCAIQVRINAETLRADGGRVTRTGQLAELRLPTGRGVRVETAAFPGYRNNPRFDSLLAKIVVHESAGFDTALRSVRRALTETRISGIDCDLAMQQAILHRAEFAERRCSTDFVDRELTELLAAAAEFEATPGEPRPSGTNANTRELPTVPVEVDADAVPAPLSGSLVAVHVRESDTVRAGQELAVLEAMKMRHAVSAEYGGVITHLHREEGEIVDAGAVLLELHPAADPELDAPVEDAPPPEHIRPDLRRMFDRRAVREDGARPAAVEKRHRTGLRTARENVSELVDSGTFREYGGFAVAAQRGRRGFEDLVANTPADGMVTGIGQVNGALFGAERGTCAVLAYDYTVLAGTQGHFNHRKTDRVLDVARRQGYPVVLFAEGGGGRPGDVDVPKVAGLDTESFSALGALSGHVPTVGIAAGRCFAGNAALLGTCDVVIATRDSNIGMGGPAMIEGGGLGTCEPADIGPIDVQERNGVVDVTVEDEAEATAVARRYLAYFQGAVDEFTEPDQRRLRHVVPADRKRVYDVRTAVEALCDEGSVLYLRPRFGECVVTALVRIDGRPMGLIANNPSVLGGAIDSAGADKLARLTQLCEVFGLPIVSLCDTPGFMVGPESEKAATVRHFGRLFVRGGRLTVPLVTVVLRKSYGLGAMAMAAGSLANPVATVSWPSGEFGGMGLEGAVRLGFRRELDAIDDPDAKQRHYEQLVAEMYERGSALNTAMSLEIDEVIDPAETRSWISGVLPPVSKQGWVNSAARPYVDPW